jgi:murein DD-endopeptidase MepM/ murein hydrolase activator NlpD
MFRKIITISAIAFLCLSVFRGINLYSQNLKSPESDKDTKAELENQSSVYFEKEKTKVKIDSYKELAEWITGNTFVNSEKADTDPQVTIFIGKKLKNGKYDIALQYTKKFDRFLKDIPGELIPEANKKYLYSTDKATRSKDKEVDLSRIFSVSAEATGSNPNNVVLSLPFAAGENWELTGGPHNALGNTAHPWAAIDVTKSSGKVRAAADGVATYLTSCPNFVSISHGGGLSTTYYHLTNIQVTNNQSVATGTYLGDVSTSAGCGGSASGPHTHFTTRINGSYQDITGLSFSGWSVTEGLYQYDGSISNGVGSSTCSSGNCDHGSVSWTAGNGCVPPSAGTWIVGASCDFTGNYTAPGNVYVQNNSTLRIKAGASLDVNTTNYNVKAQPGSTIIIENSAKIF